jgi:hypothetical protein
VAGLAFDAHGSADARRPLLHVPQAMASAFALLGRKADAVVLHQQADLPVALMEPHGDERRSPVAEAVADGLARDPQGLGGLLRREARNGVVVELQVKF